MSLDVFKLIFDVCEVARQVVCVGKACNVFEDAYELER